MQICPDCGAEMSCHGNKSTCGACGRQIHGNTPPVEGIDNFCRQCQHPLDPEHDAIGCNIPDCPCAFQGKAIERPSDVLPNADDQKLADAQQRFRDANPKTDLPPGMKDAAAAAQPEKTNARNPKNNDPYWCSCGKTFKNPGDFDRHMAANDRSHEGHAGDNGVEENSNADPIDEAKWKDKSDYADDGGCKKCKWGAPGTGHSSGFHKNDCAVLKKERDAYNHFQGAERRNALRPIQEAFEAHVAACANCGAEYANAQPDPAKLCEEGRGLLTAGEKENAHPLDDKAKEDAGRMWDQASVQERKKTLDSAGIADSASGLVQLRWSQVPQHERAQILLEVFGLENAIVIGDCKQCGAKGLEVMGGYCEKCSTISMTVEKKLKGFENAINQYRDRQTDHKRELTVWQRALEAANKAGNAGDADHAQMQIDSLNSKIAQADASIRDAQKQASVADPKRAQDLLNAVRFERPCPVCGGSAYVEDAKGNDVKCEKCRGTGVESVSQMENGWQCLECGKKFASAAAAEKAAFGDNGCPKCGGSDIDDVPDEKKNAITPEQEKRKLELIDEIQFLREELSEREEDGDRAQLKKAQAELAALGFALNNAGEVVNGTSAWDIRDESGKEEVIHLHEEPHPFTKGQNITRWYSLRGTVCSKCGESAPADVLARFKKGMERNNSDKTAKGGEEAGKSGGTVTVVNAANPQPGEPCPKCGKGKIHQYEDGSTGCDSCGQSYDRAPENANASGPTFTTAASRADLGASRYGSKP